MKIKVGSNVTQLVLTSLSVIPLCLLNFSKLFLTPFLQSMHRQYFMSRLHTCHGMLSHVPLNSDFIETIVSLLFLMVTIECCQVDSMNKPGILLEVVQVLSDLDLTISKAYITSDGRWFMDGRTCLFKQKFSSYQKIERVIVHSYIKCSYMLNFKYLAMSMTKLEQDPPSTLHTSWFKPQLPNLCIGLRPVGQIRR